MVKVFKKGLAAVLMVSASIMAHGQATRLLFPNPVGIKEWGFSATEYNGYSLIGSEFWSGLNVFKNNQLLFQTQGPGSGLFGYSHGMNSSWIAAGAPQTGNVNQGAVYLSKHLNGNPQNNFNTVITALNPGDHDQFGRALDIHDNWMVIGAPNVSNSQHGGYIEIWNLVNNNWVRKTVIANGSGNVHADFGISVAIRGNKIVVGAPGDHSIYIYKYQNNAWTLEQGYAPNPAAWGIPIYDQFTGLPVYQTRFGYDVDITDNHVIAGDPSARKSAVLVFQNNLWSLKSTLVPPATSGTGAGDQFGHSVAIQYNRAVVGAPRGASAGTNPEQGKVYLYNDEGGYKYKGILNVGTPANLTVRALGYAVAIDGDNVLAGASNSDNQLTIGNEGAAFRMPFYQYTPYRSAHDFDLDEESAGKAIIYPNPSSGNEVKLNNNLSVVSAEVVSLIGEIIPLTVSEGTINVSTLKKGIYNIKIKTDTEVFTEKLVVE
ncbi:T9SS type A sorting domain-containing protein [Sporocytophaga myxococcoides]|uniref:T9SS type A sorting domain-containing protein n=1 Tax=Sporocytophaga myxococcoides TaxID=153721 RepID=UPI000411DC24|nr:T9SS type A sorting domain-containing protein [Sporocytophaga myxococcoides]